MVELLSATRRFFRRTTLTATGLTLLAATFAAEPAYARHHYYRHYAQRTRAMVPHHGFRHFGGGGGFVPPFAAFAVDGNSGRVLYGKDENAPRHPASITKVMTLYLLFDQIEKGHITLDTRIAVSEHAAAQSPTKLGLRPGSTIRVEDAIKSIVTKSANDMAVAVAERIGGDEDTFARLMTRRAHSLGMSRTTFVNASGLPDDRQITTARDLATLGRAIHDHFPTYYRFFSTPSFRYAGQFMANHNHLMEQVEGMDGIKTGYTNASGFNLLSSVNRNGHWLVSVVLGGRTRLGRDRIMADLIEAQIDNCATRRTAPMIAENSALEQVAEAVPVVQHEGDSAPPVEAVTEEQAEDAPTPPPAPPRVASVPDFDPGAARAPRNVAEAEADAAQPPKPQIPVKVATLAPAAAPKPRPAFVSGIPRPPERDMLTTGSIRPRARLDGATPHGTVAATATPSAFKHAARHEHQDHQDRNEKAKPQPIRVASLDNDLPTGRPSNARGGWMIQIGATPTIGEANNLLARAKGQSHGALGGAKPFTEKVGKGGSQLFRARFAGLDAGAADTACKTLKRAGIACFATKN